MICHDFTNSYNCFKISITYFMTTINEQYLHCMTWYTGTCGRTAMNLVYGLRPMATEIYNYVMMGFGSNGCFVTGAPCLNWGHGYNFASSLGYPRLDLIGPLVYDGMHTISGAPVLYYRSIRTGPTLSRMG